MRLILQPLTAEAFAPFGEVLEAPAEPGRTYFEHALGNRRPEVPPSISITHRLPTALPMASATMERHPTTSQSFIPMDAARWIIVVAPHAAKGGPDMTKARAFLARPDQGITYGVDVWHHPFTVLDRPQRFAIMMWRDGSPQDDEFVSVPPFEVAEPSP